MTRAILLSGGIDSTSLCYWLRPELAITIVYGQRAAHAEVSASAEICRVMGIAHEIVRVDCSEVGAGSMSPGATQIKGLSDGALPMPEWWPFRNQLLITLGSARAVARGASELIIGTVATDSCHLDGGPTFLRLVDELTKCQEGSLHVSAPAHLMTSVRLVKESRVPRPLLAWAHSCHIGDFACGKCRGCQKHRDVMVGLEAEQEICR
jgi:7-cyano-7-deazaguanine synthase